MNKPNRNVLTVPIQQVSNRIPIPIVQPNVSPTTQIPLMYEISGLTNTGRTVIGPITTITTPRTPAVPMVAPRTPAVPIIAPRTPAVPITTTMTPSVPTITPRTPAVPIITPRTSAVPITTTMTPAVPIIAPKTLDVPIPTTMTLAAPIPTTMTLASPITGKYIVYPTKQLAAQAEQTVPATTRVLVPVTTTRVLVPITPEMLVPIKPKPVIIPTTNILESIQMRLARAAFEVYIPVLTQNIFQISRYGSPGEFSAAIRQRRLKIHVDNDVVWLMEELMSNKNLLFALQVLESLGFISFGKNPGTSDMYYNLLWYLNLVGVDASTSMREQLDYVSGLGINELLIILGPRYAGPTDRASLLFAITTGKSSAKPNIFNLPRYPQIVILPPWLVWTVAMNRYKIISPDGLVSVYPPYVHWAVQPESVLNPILFMVTEQNVDNLMTTYQIQGPLWLYNRLRNQTEKVKYFVKEILNYEPVLTRAATTLPPPILTWKSLEQIRNILPLYTLTELINAYEPVGTWSNRSELIETIALEARGIGPRWSWRHRNCNNDDTINIITTDRHGDIDKDDPTDPTLSYGVQKDYRCYQVSELVAAFGDYDGTFVFRVPDWIVTGPGLGPDFPLASIHQLLQLLQTSPPEYNVGQLIAKIREGLALHNEDARLIYTLKTQYDKFTPEQQYLAKLYLVWLFIYGMWMRFWKGPGFSWPTFRVDVSNPTAREREQRCSPEDRDEHSFIQQAIRTAFVETYEKDPLLREWIESLPKVRYSFKTGHADINREPIIYLLDRLMLGDVCQGFAGDDVAETGYYLVTRIFNLNKAGMFDTLIAETLPPILNIEQQVVNNQLAAIKNPDANDDVRRRVRILRERQTALAQPIPKQPTFEPANVEHNFHTYN